MPGFNPSWCTFLWFFFLKMRHSFSFSYGIFPTEFFLRHYSFWALLRHLSYVRHHSYGIFPMASLFLPLSYGITPTPSLFLPLSYGLSLKAIISFMGNCLCIVNMLYNLYVHIYIFDISFVHTFYFVFSIFICNLAIFMFSTLQEKVDILEHPRNMK